MNDNLNEKIFKAVEKFILDNADWIDTSHHLIDREVINITAKNGMSVSVTTHDYDYIATRRPKKPDDDGIMLCNIIPDQVNLTIFIKSSEDYKLKIPIG